MTISVKRRIAFPCIGARRTRFGLASRPLARGFPLSLLAGLVVVALTLRSRSQTWLGGHGGASQVPASVGIGMTPVYSDAPTPASWCRSLLHLSPRSSRDKPHKKRNVVGRRDALIDFSAFGINELGQDLFVFLFAAICVYPASRRLNISPLLGFLIAGAILTAGELWNDNSDEAAIADFGVLFLLFEIGTELTLDRLTRLGTYAVTLGLPALLISTVLLAALGLPPGEGVGTMLLMSLGGADPSLVSIKNVVEGIVVGAGLSLSSSAFVLQLLRDEGVIGGKLGNAVIGVLLLQDIAVVPLLALLPIVPLLGDGSGGPDSLANFGALALGGAKGLAVLALVGLVSRFVARPFLMKTAQEFGERSDALTAGVVFTIVLASLCTKGAGLSDTLGAFLIGILLADSGEVDRIEEAIAPFKGLLLGLFFLTVGASLDINLLVSEWPSIVLFLGGFMMVKAAAFVVLGVLVAGLSRYEAVRLGFVLAQGGEFAFVVFQLADDLKILPDDLNDFLLIVIVLSIALTPALNSLGIAVASMLPKVDDEAEGENAGASIEAAPPMRPVASNVDEHEGVEAVLVTKAEAKVVAPARAAKG